MKIKYINSETKRVPVTNNSFITRTIDLKLNKVVVPWSSDRFYKEYSKPINKSSIIFSKFNMYDNENSVENSLKKTIKTDTNTKKTLKHNEFMYNLLMPKHEKGWRLINKFKNNPYAFCADSKYIILRAARFLFKNK